MEWDPQHGPWHANKQNKMLDPASNFDFTPGIPGSRMVGGTLVTLTGHSWTPDAFTTLHLANWEILGSAPICPISCSARECARSWTFTVCLKIRNPEIPLSTSKSYIMFPISYLRQYNPPHTYIYTVQDICIQYLYMYIYIYVYVYVYVNVYVYANVNVYVYVFVYVHVYVYVYVYIYIIYIYTMNPSDLEKMFFWPTYIWRVRFLKPGFQDSNFSRGQLDLEGEDILQ